MTFSDFWICYFDPEVISKRKISTQQMYHYLGEKHLLPYFGARRLCDLERADGLALPKYVEQIFWGRHVERFHRNESRSEPGDAEHEESPSITGSDSSGDL